MEESLIISGNTVEEIWTQIDSFFAKDSEIFEFNAIIKQENHTVEFNLDIDLGGGFEGGYALTRFVSSLKIADGFKFSLHRQDLIDGIGKFLGMQDVEIGDPEFDKTIVIKTNDEERLKAILNNSAVLKVIETLPDFNFHIIHHHSARTEVESASLELRIDEGITDTSKLRLIYAAFMLVLDKIDPVLQ